MSSAPDHGRGRAGASSRGLKLAAGVLAVLLLALAYQSVRMGLAGTGSQAAHRDYERFASAPRKGGLEQIERLVRESLAHAETNPTALNLLGTIELARMGSRTTPAAAREAARDALKTFAAALQFRPTSPFLWANVALAKMYLDELDDDFVAAFGAAATLGPWEPRVQEMTVFVGLAAWSRLTPELKQSVGDAIGRGGKYNPERIFTVLRNFGRADLACGRPEYLKIATTMCDGTASRSKG